MVWDRAFRSLEARAEFSATARRFIMAGEGGGKIGVDGEHGSGRRWVGTTIQWMGDLRTMCPGGAEN